MGAGDQIGAGEHGTLTTRWPILTTCSEAAAWLRLQADLGLAPRTLEAYARCLADYLAVCQRESIDPLTAGRAEIARYVRDLAHRPSRRGPNVVVLDSGAGLANATLQQRLVAVRLFYDHLIEEGYREINPVGRGRYTPGRGFAGQWQRGLGFHWEVVRPLVSTADWCAAAHLVNSNCDRPGTETSLQRPKSSPRQHFPTEPKLVTRLPYSGRDARA